MQQYQVDPGKAGAVYMCKDQEEWPSSSTGKMHSSHITTATASKQRMHKTLRCMPKDPGKLPQFISGSQENDIRTTTGVQEHTAHNCCKTKQPFCMQVAAAGTTGNTQFARKWLMLGKPIAGIVKTLTYCGVDWIALGETPSHGLHEIVLILTTESMQHKIKKTSSNQAVGMLSYVWSVDLPRQYADSMALR